ncbi:MAG: asparagine synthase (glutamine-hydrolyzing) [Burkholderiaceae bacterium]
MCGFAGVVHPQAGVTAEIGKMLDRIAHRGPDDSGIYEAGNGQTVILGHRRLAIIDPENGRQPMHSADGALTLIYNGAIYNYLELRRELLAKGHPIRTYSDSEVLLYAYREWGEACVDRLLGMFSFAIWDASRRRLFAARDRIGIKPFYYSFDGDRFVFGSEIKALLADPTISARANERGLRDYLTFQFCLGEKTLFAGISRLEPGQCLTLTIDGSRASLSVRTYWDLHYDIDESHDESWFVDHLAGLIEDSTRVHLRSDVPLGAHLSGGLDSSTVVCLAAGMLQSERLKTFTGAFHEGPQFDETGYAKQVAESASTRLPRSSCRATNWPPCCPGSCTAHGQAARRPRRDSAVLRLSTRGKTCQVVLGGQGGDELFIGYALSDRLPREVILSAIYETASSRPYAVSRSVDRAQPAIDSLDLPADDAGFSRGPVRQPRCLIFGSSIGPTACPTCSRRT